MFKNHERNYILNALKRGMFSGDYRGGIDANVTLLDQKLSLVFFTRKEVHEIVEDVSDNLKQDEGKTTSGS